MNEYLLILIILLSCVFLVVVLSIVAEFFLNVGKNIKRIADALEKIAISNKERK